MLRDGVSPPSTGKHVQLEEIWKTGSSAFSYSLGKKQISFANRAEMYKKRRTEVIISIEEVYRADKALAERYDHMSRYAK